MYLTVFRTCWESGDEGGGVAGGGGEFVSPETYGCGFAGGGSGRGCKSGCCADVLACRCWGGVLGCVCWRVAPDAAPLAKEETVTVVSPESYGCGFAGGGSDRGCRSGCCADVLACRCWGGVLGCVCWRVAPDAAPLAKEETVTVGVIFLSDTGSELPVESLKSVRITRNCLSVGVDEALPDVSPVVSTRAAAVPGGGGGGMLLMQPLRPM